jgi:uncharacterized protein YpuA (DUF1002 family)
MDETIEDQIVRFADSQVSLTGRLVDRIIDLEQNVQILVTAIEHLIGVRHDVTAEDVRDLIAGVSDSMADRS